VVISPAESLNVAASNALLKSLEEPPSGVLFLLVSDRPATLLPTVRSRCQMVPVRLREKGAAQAWLREHGFDDPELSLALCGGAPLQAASIAAIPAWERRREFLRSLSAGGADAIAIAEAYRELPPGLVLSWLQKWTFDLMLMRACARAHYHVDLSEAIGRIARGCDPISIARVHRSLLALQRHVNHPLNPRLFLEQMLIMYRRAVTASEAQAA
jgi:DNA polymerase III subunit delta'